jgi:hypothetical protein
MSSRRRSSGRHPQIAFYVFGADGTEHELQGPGSGGVHFGKSDFLER